MWIMLIKKLSTDPSPPRLSIFWSTPWPDDKYAASQLHQWLSETNAPVFRTETGFWRDWLKSQGLPEGMLEDGEERLLNAQEMNKRLLVAYSVKAVHYYGAWGLENNWAGARKIHYKDNDIRVFPDEFSVMTTEKMAAYTGLSDDASHEFVPGTVADATLVQEVLSGSLREIFEAAMVDGCAPEQARAMAFGVDVQDELASLPPIGWYRCKREYAEIFCQEWEMEE